MSPDECRPVEVTPDGHAADHVCDTCRQPCQGGCRDYSDPRGFPRHGCNDDVACMAAWKRAIGAVDVPH